MCFCQLTMNAALKQNNCCLPPWELQYSLESHCCFHSIMLSHQRWKGTTKWLMASPHKSPVMRKTKRLGDVNRKNMFLPCFFGSSQRQHVSGGPFGKSILENRIKWWSVGPLKWGGYLWINNCKKKKSDHCTSTERWTWSISLTENLKLIILQHIWVYLCHMICCALVCKKCKSMYSLWKQHRLVFGEGRKVAGLQGSEIRPIACSESRK